MKPLFIQWLLALIILLLSNFNACAATLKATAQPSQLRHVTVNDELSLDIYVPKNQSNKRFPTLYVMDGQHYMFNAIGYQKALTKGTMNVDVSPEFIVVGINTSALNESGIRGTYLNRRSSEFIALLNEHIIPYVDKHTPSNQERYYFGWQFAATAGLSLFNSHPRLFKGYLLASGPYYTDTQFQQLEATLKNNAALNTQFYLSLGKQELHATDAHNTFSTILGKYPSSGVQHKYNYFDRFSIRYDHFTTVFDSFSHGLEWLFSDYPDMTFYSVADIQQFGGINAVKTYYQKRGARYNLSPEVGNQAKFSMFRHAVEEDNLAFFQQLEDALGQYEVKGWHTFFARFFAKHGLLNRAEKTYQDALVTRPESHKIWAELADVYVQQKRHQQALSAYQNALQFAPAGSDLAAGYAQKISNINAL